MANAKPKRNYKSRIFEMVFREKKELLELYNAINGTNYQNPEALEINTLENAIYMSMKNDVSFVIDLRLNLYEHQSTVNPNLPLRDLFYVSDLYSVMTKDMNLYGKKLIRLPSPKFIVFYNGIEEMPERQELKLSDAFIIEDEEVALELKVLVLNINRGYNSELLNACKTLKDYSEYVERVRQYAKIMPIEDAVDRAIKECIDEGILAEFLSLNMMEAKKMSIYEYDEEKHMRWFKEEAFEEGEQKGREEGRVEGREEGRQEGEQCLAALAQALMSANRLDDLEKALKDKVYREELYKEFELA